MNVKKIVVLVLALALMVMTLSACASMDVQRASNGQGLKAPDFTLPDQNGTDVTLSEVLAKYRGAVIAFYPKDDSRN